MPCEARARGRRGGTPNARQPGTDEVGGQRSRRDTPCHNRAGLRWARSGAEDPDAAPHPRPPDTIHRRSDRTGVPTAALGPSASTEWAAEEASSASLLSAGFPGLRPGRFDTGISVESWLKATRRAAETLGVPASVRATLAAALKGAAAVRATLEPRDSESPPESGDATGMASAWRRASGRTLQQGAEARAVIVAERFNEESQPSMTQSAPVEDTHAAACHRCRRFRLSRPWASPCDPGCAAAPRSGSGVLPTPRRDGFVCPSAIARSHWRACETCQAWAARAEAFDPREPETWTSPSCEAQHGSCGR